MAAKAGVDQMVYQENPLTVVIIPNHGLPLKKSNDRHCEKLTNIAKQNVLVYQLDLL